MKFLLSLFLANVAVASSVSIKADSSVGAKLLSQARRLEEDDNEADMSWVVGYSLKFQGCHHIKQWNSNAEDDEDVKIETKRLIRFRLCPTDTCSETLAGGCKSGYGDYVLDLGTYMNSYYELKEEVTKNNCENYMNNNCNCDDDDGQGDDFDRDECEYNCFANAGMAECFDEEEGALDVKEYLECAQLEVDNDEGRRRLEEEEAQYFLGPYCAQQGGEVVMGLFTEDTCSEFADDYGGKSTFEGLTGYTLPYSSESLVGMECLSCQDVEEDGDGNVEYAVYEQVEELYKAAGKCEANLAEGTVDEPNSNACSYMEGIKIAREDGTIRADSSRANPVVTAFIVIFAMAFAAMGFYVYYLRRRLGVKKEPLMM